MIRYMKNYLTPHCITQDKTFMAQNRVREKKMGDHKEQGLGDFGLDYMNYEKLFCSTVDASYQEETNTALTLYKFET